MLTLRNSWRTNVSNTNIRWFRGPLTQGGLRSYKKIKSFGFDVLGFAKPIVEEKTKKQYLDFLNKNHHGEMRWLERHFEKKINPKKVWDKVKSIIVIGYNYSLHVVE